MITSVSIGHEILVTPLQLAASYAVLANGGWRVRPHFAREAEREQVLSAETCNQIRAMLVEGVDHGTGFRARREGVRIAGKTGTSQKFDPAIGRYSREKFVASFACFAPAGPDETPRMVVVVTIDEPKAGTSGGRVAAPVAGAIISRSLPLLK